MVTTYYLKGGLLMLTPYCASGHHPMMARDGQTTKAMLVFAFAGATNFDPERTCSATNKRGPIILEERKGCFTNKHHQYDP